MARDPNHEHRKRYEHSLGIELGGLFAELWQELVWLHTVWDEYCVIFCTTPDKLDIANRAAVTFFYIVRKQLFEDVLLQLARITDPAESMGKRNLSVTALFALVKDELKPELSVLIDKALIATKFTKDWRNRYIAHKDLSLALSHEAAPSLQQVSRTEVGEALAVLDELLNSIDRSYNNTSTMFNRAPSHTGSKRLLQLLEKGLNAETQDRLEEDKRWGLE